MIKREDLLAWIGQRIGKPPGWERLVRRFAGPNRFRGRGDFCMVRDGSAFIAQPSVPLGWHVLMFGSYEPELRRIFSTLLKPGMVAIDVGANVGWHTLLMARQVGACGRVLAVEANPSVHERLIHHLAINGMGQVELVPCALGATAGTVSFFGPSDQDAESGNGYVVSESCEGPHAGGIITVETRTLDQVVESAALTRLDVIKIDVEGYEWPVLQGAEESIARFRPHLFFEYVTEYSGRGGGTPTELTSFFERHDYRLFKLSRNWAEQVTRTGWPDCADIWAVPNVIELGDVK